MWYGVLFEINVVGKHLPTQNCYSKTHQLLRRPTQLPFVKKHLRVSVVKMTEMCSCCSKEVVMPEGLAILNVAQHDKKHSLRQETFDVC